MMPNRDMPYSAFNYLVSFNNAEAFGGFSEVSGLGVEFTVAEYRNGNDPENHVRKVVGMHKPSDTTIKRGVINSKTVWEWIKAAYTGGPAVKMNVRITLLDEERRPVQSWLLRNAVPKSYKGPTLTGKGAEDVAIEEMVLAAEGFEIDA
ncbi:MAG: phage tail protein [Caldilineaceae bacterium]|nr:phage tail protein [Caldilineaceae bacterium]